MSPDPGKTFLIATEPFLFLYFVSYGIFTSIVPQLTVFKVCHGIYNSTVCSRISTGVFPIEEKIVYEQATKWSSIIFASACVPSSMTIMFIGSLSDLVSKKKLLLLVPIAITLQSIILVLSASFPASSMVFIAIAAGLPGMYGDNQGTVMLAYSYIADVTKRDETRTVRMVILEGTIFLSLGLTCFTAGLLMGKYGYVIVFSLSLSAGIANFIFVAFILPETTPDHVSKDEQKTIRQRLKHCWDNLEIALSSILSFFQTYLLSLEYKRVFLLLLAALFTNAAVLGENSILVMYLQHKPLALSSDQIGEFLLVLHLLRGIGVIFVAIMSLKLLKLPDWCIVMIGQISIISTHLGVGLSPDLDTLFAITPLNIAYPLALSGLRSLLTKMVEQHEHGMALSFFALVSIIGLVLVTFSSNRVFRLTADFFPGLSVILLAVTCFVGLVLSAVLFCIIGVDAGKCKDGSEGNEQVEQETIALLASSRVK